MNSKKKIIGFTGKIGSGKSLAAEYLANRYNGKIIPFAKPLKDIAYQMGWNGEKDEKGRRLLQLLGTECGRECIDTNIWVKKWIQEVGKSDSNLIIADDVRFDNEAIAVRSLGGVIFEITRDCNLSSDHMSESGIHPRYIKMKIPNNSDKESLYDVLDFCYTSFYLYGD